MSTTSRPDCVTAACDTGGLGGPLAGVLFTARSPVPAGWPGTRSPAAGLEVIAGP